MSLRGHKPKQHDAFLSLLVLHGPPLYRSLECLTERHMYRVSSSSKEPARAESLCHRRRLVPLQDSLKIRVLLQSLTLEDDEQFSLRSASCCAVLSLLELDLPSHLTL